MKKIKLILLSLMVMLTICGCGTKKLENISLIVDDIIPVNETKLVKVVYEPAEVEEEITWTTSDEKIATISDGNIKAISTGNVKITATTTSGITKSKTITVYIPATEFNISDSNAEMYVGDEKQLIATVTPDEATFKTIKWESKNPSIATVDETGKVSAKSSGETIIVATTEEGLNKECNITVKEKPIEYSGSGDKIISNVNIPSGNYKAVLSNSGSSNFIVKFYENSNDSYGDLLANEIGSYNGSVVIREGGTTAITGGMLEVKSSGNWTIKFEKISGTISGKSISGSGDTVTGWFNGDGKRQVATFSNSGSSNFIVKVYNQYGDRDLLVNEIGSYNGQATFTTNSSGKYYYEVISSGSWTISWE